MNPEALIGHYGYLAIFLFLAAGIVLPLIPDETMLVIAGVFVQQSRLSFVPAIGAAFAGSMCGITVSYLIGRSGVAHWLHRRAEDKLRRVHDWFERFGRWTLFFGYFVVGVRHFTALVAGSTEMRYPVFAVFAYSGAFFWVVTFISLGYFAGGQWQHVAHLLHRGALALAVGAAIVAGAVWIWHHQRRA